MHDLRTLGSRRVLEIVCLALAVLAPRAAAQQASEPLMKDMMGVNGHTILFQPDLYGPLFDLVRDYHNFSWDVGSNTGNDTQFPFAANGVNWNSVYGSWANGGFTTDASIQFNAFSESAWKNVAVDAYQYGYAFAEYFGPTQGNGLVQSIEIGNEPGYYSDSFYRTLFQNMAAGIRAADANLTIVTPNVTTGSGTEYAVPLSVFQGLTDQLDVIAVHTYPHLTGYPTWEPSYPEDPRLGYLQNVQDVIDWRDRYAPGKEIWITEFGYDSTNKPNQTSGTFSEWMHVTDTQQAQYLTRSFLAFSEMDVDRAYIYFFNDSDSAQLHGASGLTRNYVPKPSYYAIRHMQQRLGEYKLSSVLEKSAGDLYVYAYQHGENPHDQIWVLWSPTGEGREVEITLDLRGGTVQWAELMPLVNGPAPLVPYELLPDGSIRLTVGESPTYLAVTMPEPAAMTGLLLGAVAMLRRRRR